MISDVLCEAISEIDRYLSWDTYQDDDGKPDPEIVRVRNEMKGLLIELINPDELIPPEAKEWKRQALEKLKKGKLV